MHGFIPHNHHQEHTSGCTEIYHSCHDDGHATDNTNNNEGEITDIQTEEDKHFICHFNAGPFHPLDNDTPFFPEEARNVQPHESLPQAHNVYYSQPFISSLLFLPDNLRAPPTPMGKV